MTPLDLDTQSNMSYALLEAVEHQLPWSTLSDYPQQLAHTTPADLTSAIGACVDHQVTLVSGPTGTIGPQLKAAGIAYELFDWRTEGLHVLQDISPKAAARVKRERAELEKQIGG